VAQPISITAFSTALFSTWVFVEQFGLLFDCGDGATSTLLQKSRKVRHAFISHADRDHLTGLLQFNQLNGREGLSIYYPQDAGSFPAMADFTSKFDPHIAGTSWIPISNHETIAIKNDLQVVAMANRHVTRAPELTKSLSFVVQRSKKKLKPKFADLQGQEIASLRKELSDDQLFEMIKDVELIYSGDTPVETDGRYSNARILIHEATFLDREELGPERVDRNYHSSLDAVMEMVADSNIENLILSHFSSRYSDAQIDDAVAREKERCGIDIPVFVIYPGRVSQFEI